MTDAHVLAGLVAKYRMLKGQLRIREVEAERIRATMASLEVTIRLFKAETAFDDIPAQLPRQPSRFRPGQRYGRPCRSYGDPIRP